MFCFAAQDTRKTAWKRRKRTRSHVPLTATASLSGGFAVRWRQSHRKALCVVRLSVRHTWGLRRLPEVTARKVQFSDAICQVISSQETAPGATRPLHPLTVEPFAYRGPSQSGGNSQIGSPLVRHDFRLGTPGVSDVSLR